MFGGKKDDNADCPFWQGPCRKEKCRMWVGLQGTNPNTGEEVNRQDCSLAFLPMLLVENSQQQRQTGAAVESFRNEVVEQQTRLTRADAMKQLLGVGQRDVEPR